MKEWSRPKVKYLEHRYLDVEVYWVLKGLSRLNVERFENRNLDVELYLALKGSGLKRHLHRTIDKAEVMAECRARADANRPASKPRNYAGAAMIVAVWLLLAAVCVRWVLGLAGIV